MSVYFEFIKIAFKNSFAYKIDAYIGVAARILSIFISVSLWKALYQNSSAINSGAGFVSLEDMVTYSIISAALSIIIEIDVVYKLDDKIRSGSIATDLIRPLNFMKLTIADFAGNNIASLILQFIPVFMLANILYKIHYPTLLYFTLFIISVANSAVINFLISYTVGLLSFWWYQIWPVEMFIRSVKRILSGAWVPIWFFPDVLVYISNLLPFKYIYYIPLSIYLHKFDLKTSLVFIFQQGLWVIALIAIERITWNKSIKKLVIQGG